MFLEKGEGGFQFEFVTEFGPGSAGSGSSSRFEREVKYEFVESCFLFSVEGEGRGGRGTTLAFELEFDFFLRRRGGLELGFGSSNSSLLKAAFWGEVEEGLEFNFTFGFVKSCMCFWYFG